MTWLNTDGGAGTVLEGFPASVKPEPDRDRRGSQTRTAAGRPAVDHRHRPGRHRLGRRLGFRAMDPPGRGPAGAAVGRDGRAGDAPDVVVPRVLRAVDAAADPGDGVDHLAGREGRPGVEHRLPRPAQRCPCPAGLRVLVPDRAADAADGRGSRDGHRRRHDERRVLGRGAGLQLRAAGSLPATNGAAAPGTCGRPGRRRSSRAAAAAAGPAARSRPRFPPEPAPPTAAAAPRATAAAPTGPTGGTRKSAGRRRRGGRGC